MSETEEVENGEGEEMVGIQLLAEAVDADFSALTTTPRPLVEHCLSCFLFLILS